MQSAIVDSGGLGLETLAGAPGLQRGMRMQDLGSVVAALSRRKNVEVADDCFWNMGLRVGRSAGTLGFSRPEDKYAKI